MRKFLLHSALFALLLLTVVFIAGHNYYPSEKDPKTGYMGIMYDKHVYADRAKSPRIIFAGGSNLAFGLNSKRVEDSLRIPVVNLGLYGGLGLDFMLKEVKDTAKPGDIIVLSIEYFLSVEGDYQAKREAAMVYPPAKQFYTPSFKQLIGDFFVEDVQSHLPVTLSALRGTSAGKTLGSTVYSHGAFNEQGDVVRNFDPHISHGFMETFRLQYMPYPGIGTLNTFKAYCDKKQLRVLFVYPNFPAGLYHSQVDVIDKYRRDLEMELTIPIVNKPADAVLPDSLFYDTAYHLLPAGREIQTSRLINLLKLNNVRNRGPETLPTID